MARNAIKTNPVNTAALDAMAPERLAEAQRAVDLAVRKARREGLCDLTEAFLGEIYPELAVMGEDRYGTTTVNFYSTDGISCNGTDLAIGVRTYDADGYDQSGYDRDGFGRSWHRDTDTMRPGRPATEEELAAEAAARADVINPTTYKPTA